MTTRTGEGAHTAGNWSFRIYAQEDKDLEFMRQHNMEPTRALSNDGQIAIMCGDGDDVTRVALVDCQTKFKRGQGYKTDCAERDANARLIAAAPDLLEALKRCEAMVSTDQGPPDWDWVRSVIAKATTP